MKKTIAMTCILKDELHNLPRFCESISGLFDEYHFTDTGSKDGSVAWLMHESDKALGCRPDQVHIHHFKWIDNFAAARNFALPMITSDYWAWLDLDDVLDGRENFEAWRQEAMPLGEVFYIPYHYALKPDGSPLVSFIRERIFKNGMGLKFQDFIHEGVNILRAEKQVTQAHAVQSFSVKHMRTVEEMNADRGRNLRILEDQKDILSPRLQFYYGKELFDQGRFEDCARVLKENIKNKEMEQGDRIMAFQYLCHAFNTIGTKESLVEAICVGILGIQMEPNRAEYHCLIADSYMKLQEPHKAVPFYSAAKACQNGAASGMSHEFSFAEGYSTLPRINLANIYISQGYFEKALDEIHPLRGSNEKIDEMVSFCEKAIKDTMIPDDSKLLEVDDIVITCPNPNAYDWDEEIYKTKGLGGSETAAVEMAMHLRKLTGKNVKIFQHRKDRWVSKSGVEYIPAPELHHYFQKYKPSLHIAWRHTARFTNARSVVWSHDLQTMGAENHQNYDHILALSEFHKTFLMGTQGVPSEKILVTRNGIDPRRFSHETQGHGGVKKYAKVIWPNSPDRGLDWAMKIMDLVRLEIPEAELHCFYGMDNLEKYGMGALADKLKHMLATRPHVKYIGNVNQTRLAHEFLESQVWLYSASFIETFCVSAIEAMSAQCWPVVRKFGALKSTLKDAEEKGYADIIDCDMNEEAVPVFAQKVIDAIKEEKWRKIDFDPESVSWSSVAVEWQKMFNL